MRTAISTLFARAKRIASATSAAVLHFAMLPGFRSSERLLDLAATTR
jgi:hypothetical protein